MANALSDVYAMGGVPLTAMNIICFPINTLDRDILKRTLLGGLDTMHKAGVILVGGHSVEDQEFKYGLSVTGTVHPDKVLLNSTARVGDKVILTKALGTGIINTAVKAHMADEALEQASINCMKQLNKTAAEAMIAVGGTHACTDVTGFGLLGHAAEMIEGKPVGMTIRASAVPVFDGLRPLAEMGILPGGLHRNKKYRLPIVTQGRACPGWLFDVFFDPQTSGGLLISVDGKKAETLLSTLQERGVGDAAIIGEITAEGAGHISVE